jgi:hypothetical protein
MMLEVGLLVYHREQNLDDFITQSEISMATQSVLSVSRLLRFSNWLSLLNFVIARLWSNIGEFSFDRGA